MSDSQGSARPRYKLVVSDFHLGKGRHFRDGSQNLLEDFVYDREFADFLDYHRLGEFKDAEVELILNGDFLNLLQIDDWGIHTHLITERATARAVERIVKGHPELFQALRRWALTPGHSIAYVVGNHDVGMLWHAPRRAFSAACGAEVAFHDVSYEFDGVHVEHGQQYERFARINMERPFITKGLPEPVLDLPWGSLFVAVVLPGIKQERPHVDKVRPFRSFLQWCLLNDPWWGVRTGFRIVRFVLETILFKSRFHIRHGVGATWSLLREISLYPSYDRIAFRILEEFPDIHTVIFGHTHVLRYRQWHEGKEYFNEGSWNEVTVLELGEYGTRVRFTYAFIEYGQKLEDGTYRPKTRLKEWKGVWRADIEVLT